MGWQCREEGDKAEKKTGAGVIAYSIKYTLKKLGASQEFKVVSKDQDRRFLKVIKTTLQTPTVLLILNHERPRASP